MPPSRLVACGLTTLDVLQTVDRLPGPDEKVVARELLVESGGPAANAAVAAVALGVPTTLVTRVGGGALGAAVAGDLRERGVDVVDLAGPDDAPPVSTVLVTAGTGQRAVVSVNATRGTSAAAGDDPADVAWDDVGALLVDGHHLDLAVPLAAAARAAGVVVLLDGGSWKPGLETLLTHVDVALLSADLRLPGSGSGPAGPLSRDEATALLRGVAALGPAVVARSQGAGPVQLLDPAAPGGQRAVAVPSLAPADLVDTLGAGDVLHGAFAAWLARRARTGPVPEHVPAGLAFAARAATASCGAPGARGWLADDAQVTALRAELTAS